MILLMYHVIIFLTRNFCIISDPNFVLLIILRLRRKHFRINPVLFSDQRIVRTIFRYFSVAKNRNMVAELAGRKAVRDIDRGLSADQRMELAVNLIFRNRVKRCRRLVKDDNRCVFIERSGDRKLLLLAARRLNSLFIKGLKQHRIHAML